MRTRKKLFFCLIWTLFSVALSHARSTEKKVYEWLVLQQDSSSGILGNQEYDDFSGIYSNALAAMCYIHQGDIERAERVFRFFEQHYDSEFASGTPKGFHQFWKPSSGEVFPDLDRWVGDNAWLLIALNYYAQVTGKNDFAKMQKGIAEWLISLQDTDGGILSGFRKIGPMNWKSTEGNLDSYAAIIDYPEERKKVKEYLTTYMWVPREKRFKMGSTVKESGLDCIAWAIGALGKEFKNTLGYAERKFLRTAKTDSHNKEIKGFSDFVDKKRVWFEGTAQMAVAYQVAEEHKKAKYYIKQLEKAMIKSRRFTKTMGLPCSSNDPAWVGASTEIFVPSGAWYLFAKWKFNPFDSSKSSTNNKKGE